MPFATNGTSPLPANNRLMSFDSKLQFKNGLRLDGEIAYSFTDFDRRFAGACAAPCDTRIPQPTLDRTQGDWGGRIEGNWRMNKWSLRTAYVRYQPNFASINARQISDLADFAFRTSYDMTDWLTVDATVRHSNNDLKKQLPFQTTLWGPEGKMVFHDLPFYKRGTLELGYRHRNVNLTAPGTVTWNLQANNTTASGSYTTTIALNDSGVSSTNTPPRSTGVTLNIGVNGQANYTLVNTAVTNHPGVPTGANAFQVGETVNFSVDVVNNGTASPTGSITVDFNCTPGCGSHPAVIAAPPAGQTVIANLSLPVNIAVGSYTATFNIVSAPVQTSTADELNNPRSRREPKTFAMYGRPCRFL